MKVYIVTQGEYSDYRIKAVFTDNEQAELYAAVHSGEYDPCEVEKWDTDEVHMEGAENIKRLWIIIVNALNNEVSSIEWHYTTADINEIKRYTPFRTYDTRYKVMAALDKNVSEAQAKKIMLDRLAAWKYEHL